MNGTEKLQGKRRGETMKKKTASRIPRYDESCPNILFVVCCIDF